MAHFILSVLDTTGIQDYIFGSNRLRENVGASFLVEQATRDWVGSLLPSPHNFGTDGVIRLGPLEAPDSEAQAEVIYRGGGNVVFLTRDVETARAFVRRLSGKVIESAPGLELAAAHMEFDWETKPIGGKDGVYSLLLA